MWSSPGKSSHKSKGVTMKHPQLLGFNFRYRFGGGGSAKMPKARAPIATPETLSQQAQGAGQAERSRSFTKRGRRGTIFAGRRDLAPAKTSAAELRQTL